MATALIPEGFEVESAPIPEGFEIETPGIPEGFEIEEQAPTEDDFTPRVVDHTKPIPGTVVDTNPGSYKSSLNTVTPEVAATMGPLDPVADEALREREREMGVAPFSLGPEGVQDALSRSQPGQLQEPLVTLPKPENTGVGSGIVRGVESVAEGLTTPENLGLIAPIAKAPKLLQQGAALGFSTAMLKASYDQLFTAPEGETEGQAAERITGGLLTMLLGGLAGKHGASGRAPISASERAASMEKATTFVEKAQPGDHPVGTRIQSDWGAYEKRPSGEWREVDENGFIVSDTKVVGVPKGEVVTPTAAKESSQPATPPAEPLPPAGERVQGPLPEGAATPEQVKPSVEPGTAGQTQSTTEPTSVSAEGIRTSYEKLKASSGFPAVELNKLAKESGATPEQVSKFIADEVKAGNAELTGSPEAGDLTVADFRGDARPMVKFKNAPPKVEANAAQLTTEQQTTVREAYDRVRATRGDPAVPIAEVIRESGLPAEQVKSFFFEQRDQGQVHLSTGDWSIATPAERAGVVRKLGQDFLQVRYAEKAGVEGANLGPGAANANEPLASYEARKFGERFIEDKTIDPTIREQTGNRYYEPLPNRVTAEEATTIIKERGIDEATRLIRDEKNDVSPAVRSTVGQVVIKQLNESYRKLKETNPAEADKVLDKAVDLAEWQMEYGTRLGQGVQSFAMWSRLTPEGKLRTYVKAVDKARVRVEKETGGEVQKVAAAAREVSERTETKVKEDAIEREAERIARHLSDTPEFKKAKAPNEAVQLIREHLKKEVPEFADRLQEFGAKPETAASIDRMAVENRKRIAAVGREQRIEALRKRLTAEKNKTGKKLKKSTVERLMELADDGLLKDKEVWDAVSKDLGLPEYTPEISRKMAKLAAEVDGAAEGMPRNEAMQRLTKYMAEQKGFSPGELPMGIWYSNVLSGYQTHVVNAVDTGLNVMSELGTMALTNPKEIPVMVRGVIRGLAEGKSDALLALSEGRKITDGKYAEQPGILEASKFGTKGGVPIQAKGIVSRGMKAAAESKGASFLNAYKYVGRLMAASDTVFFRAAEEARAATLAFRESQAKGVEKSQLRAEADKMLGYDRIDEFRAQAKSEGYTGAKAEARTTELMMQARPEALRESAADFAGNATYNHAPQGLLGYLANEMAQVTNKVPALKLIVPFTRIVANVTNRGLDYTPYGFKRALAGRSFGDGPMFGEARTAALTKATVGTIGLTALGVLNQTGVIELHGGGPSDSEKKRQLQAAGWKPYSIKIGDTYASYLPTPLGLGLSTLGNYLDADRYQELKQKDAATRTGYAFSRIGSTVFNQSFLSGLANLMETLASSSPGKQIAGLKQLFARISSGFTVPNLLKDVNRIFDPTYRDTNSIAEDLVRDIPVIRLAMNPTLNAFGEPAQPPSNRFVSVQKSAPEWRLVVEKNLRIPVADDTVFTDPQAGYEYQKLAGQGMKSYVTGALSSLSKKTPDEAQEAITRASSSIFENARSRTRSKYPNSLRQRK